jgi:hypothetical protein
VRWRNSKSPLKLGSESKDNRIRKLIRGRRERHSPVSVSDRDSSRRATEGSKFKLGAIEGQVKMQIVPQGGIKCQNSIASHICHLTFDLTLPCAFRRNSLKDGRLVKKKRCVLHLQSDAPNPAMGTEAPRSARITRAH